uniref:Uncharacterized protein n=1 Tax=Arundo donax TaxID=35708 RepID=A0A0A9FP73_ARUDO
MRNYGPMSKNETARWGNMNRHKTSQRR